MSISKKIRFEVFKRDGFHCVYCGKTPPSVVLEVDHIQPKGKEGKDDINNLITACFDCNRGKSNIELDKIPAQLQENLEILKEKEAQLKEYRKFIQKIENRIQKDINDINEVFSFHYNSYVLSETFKDRSLKRILEFLPKHEVINALRTSISKFSKNNEINREQAIRYWCGICWRRIKGTNNY